MPRFRPAPGSPYSQADIDTTAPEIIRLVQANGGQINDAIVLDAARDQDSPLHPYVFRSNTREAAERWYLHEARKLLRSIEVTWTEPGADGCEDRWAKLVHRVAVVVADPLPSGVPSEGHQVGLVARGRPRTTRGIVLVTDVMTDPNYAQQILDQAREYLAQFRSKLAELRRILPDYQQAHPREFHQIQRFLDQHGDL